MTTPDQVLDYWFPPDPARANALWWGKNEALDTEVRERFGPTLAAAKAGALDHWTATARGRTALIIVLDQLSRNIHRGEPETYAADEQARASTLAGLAAGQDRELAPIERHVKVQPLEHSEDLADQERCVALMRALADEVDADPEANANRRKQFAGFVDYAIAHRDIVARFGRFPHRNAVLGRSSTAEELAFLTEPGSSF